MTDREQELTTELGRIERRLYALKQRREEVLDELEGYPAGLDIDHVYPTECVLCDHSAETPEAHEQHMAEVHDV